MGDSNGTDHTSFTEYHVRSGDTLASIAKRNGLTWQDLTNYNFGTDTPTRVNDALEEYVGCTQRTADGNNFIFTDKDDPGIIYIPKPDQSYDVDTGKDHPFTVPHPTFYSRIELQTVNDMGQRVGNVDLILRPDNGQPDVPISSDDTGYAEVDKVPVGRYRVLLASGKPAYMFDPNFDPAQSDGGGTASSTDADADADADDADANADAGDDDPGADANADAGDDDAGANADAGDDDAGANADAGDDDAGANADAGDADAGADANADAGDDDAGADADSSADADADDADDDKLIEVSIVTSNHTRAITRIVVEQAKTAEWRKQDQLLKEIHARTPGGEKPTEENTTPSRDSGLYATDNLALAAGWTDDGRVDESKLVKTILEGYLRIYEPTAVARGYYVLMLSHTLRNIRLINSEGNVEKTFALKPDVSTAAMFGAYAIFENVSGNLFVDLATMTYQVSVPTQPQGIAIDQIVTDPVGLTDALKSHGRQVQILYYEPSGQELVWLAVVGGTGRLEDYGTDSDVNDSIHERNLAVCKNIAASYDGYIKGYQDRVKQTENEDQLRAMGPPMTPYEMPAPAGATDDQLDDIFNALKTSELDAWVTIAQQLDKFADRLSQGYPFLRIKPKYVVKADAINKIRNLLRTDLPDMTGNVSDEVEVETNIDLQLVDGRFRVITKWDAAVKVKVKLNETVKQLTGSGTPLEISFKQNLVNRAKQTVTIKIGGFTIEQDTAGKSKLSFEEIPGVAADAEMNSSTGFFGGGVTLKFGDLAKNMKGKSPFMDKMAGYIKGFQLQIQLGFVGTRPDTIFAVINRGPGFFGRRSLDALFDPKTHWVDLRSYEQAELAALGWYGELWDGKYHKQYKDKLPESVSKEPDALTDAESSAIISLGFYAFEDYGHQFKKKVAKFADYAY